MIRIIIRRRMLSRMSTLATNELETLDVDCPELEAVLTGGGQGPDQYDYREVAWVEVLPKETGQ